LRMIHDVIIRKKHRRRKKQGGLQIWISAPEVSKETTALGSRGRKLKPVWAEKVPLSNP